MHCVNHLQRLRLTDSIFSVWTIRLQPALYGISGYFISKLIGIKVISELKKENRLKFIILSVAVAELSLVLFGALPQPFNVFALFFNGLSLGCMWGVIFSFLERASYHGFTGKSYGVEHRYQFGDRKVDWTFCDG